MQVFRRILTRRRNQRFLASRNTINHFSAILMKPSILHSPPGEQKMAKLTSLCFAAEPVFRRAKFPCKRNTSLAGISRIFASVGSRGSPCMHGARPKSGDSGCMEVEGGEGRGTTAEFASETCAGVADSSPFRSITGYGARPFIQPLHNCRADASHPCVPPKLRKVRRELSWRNGRPLPRGTNRATESHLSERPIFAPLAPPY